jgi:hypothetical protein
MSMIRLAALATVTALVCGPVTESSAEIRDASVDAAGHSDVALWDHFLIVEHHWIELHGTATFPSPCGERVLDFHLSVRGRENFYADTYEYSVDLPEGEIELRDEGQVVLQATVTACRLRLRYPRPTGPPPIWSLFGDWASNERRILLPDCTWSGEQIDPMAGGFSLRPAEHETDEIGVVITATGFVYGAIDVPAEGAGESFGMLKAIYRAPN